MKKTIIVTDGSCSGNPGPGGWAAAICRDSQDIYIAGGDKSTTNNRMELTAVLEALEMVHPTEKILVQSDSKYVVDGASIWIKSWVKNRWMTSTKKRVENKDLWEKMWVFLSQYNIEFEWVRGHSTDMIHKIDEMAKEQTQLMRNVL